MKSPFPGMDPYLESPALWADFHNSFMTYFREALAARLPDRYDARLEEQIRVVELPPPDAGTYRPDLSVIRSPGLSADAESSPEAVAVLDPTAVVPFGEPIVEEVREVRIDIYRWPGTELVTTIELLSPWNKMGDGYGDFQRKRRAMVMSHVNWVEIDLLVGGERLPLGGPTPATDYRVVIVRATAQPKAAIYAWDLREPLPKIPIPLREPDLSIPISLAEVFTMTYERGRFEKTLGRIPAGPPAAPLRAEDQSWATDLAAQRRISR
jgi:Protein of unknown function (DUF4058)